VASSGENWRHERRRGIGVIAASLTVSLGLWFALFELLAPLRGMEEPGARMMVALEQIVVFAVGLIGIAAYLESGEAMRVVPATTIVWILNRLAFWIGYHRSSAMRALGAPSMAIGLIMLLYVTARVGHDLAGVPGAVLLVGLYLPLEALLFWKTH
jgi:hypothetical protein